MSSNSILERPAVADNHDLDWIVLDEAEGVRPTVPGVEMRGTGRNRYGFVHASMVTAAPPNLVALPSVDDLDS